MTGIGEFRGVLGNRQYRYFLASAESAAVGYSVYSITVVWLSWVLSGSYLVVGAVLFIEFAAYTLSFLVGPVVDRARNQRSIFLACYPAQAVAAALIGVGYLEHFLTVALLLSLVAVISILWDFAWASSNAVPGLILTPSEQFAASGVAGAVGGVTTLGGYALGGFLILDAGLSSGIILYSLLLGLAGAFALPLRVRSATPATAQFWTSFREGWRELAARPGAPLLQLAAVDSVQGLFAGLPGLLITATSVAYFQGSSLDYGILLTTYVAGGVAASIVIGGWNPRARVGYVLAGGLAAASAGFALLTVLPSSFVPLAIGWFVVGVATTTYTNSRFAFIRGAIAPERLGRVFSNLYLFPGTAASAGALFFGGLATHAAPAGLTALVATGFVSATVLALGLPGVRGLRY